MPTTDERIGPYQLIRKLGAGGFGEVWLARNVQALYAPEVALKIPISDTIDLDAVHREASIWVQANGHPNVLPMIEASIYGNRVVIVSEFAPDGSLEDWLEQHGGQAPSITQAVELTRGILSGLAYLHARNIVHRDLKPGNILLQSVAPRIADFGISRLLRTNNLSVNVIGTPLYMAPEAFWGKRDPQTDLWAVGVILYQLLCGYLPFRGRDLIELQTRICNEEPPLPQTLPAWLQAVIKRALAKNPDVRFATAEEMRAARRKPHITPPQPQPAPQPDPPVYFVTPETVPRPHPPRPVTVPQPQPLPLTVPVTPPHQLRLSRLVSLLAVMSGIVYLSLFNSAQPPKAPLNNVVNTSPGTLPAPARNPTFLAEDIKGVQLQLVLVLGGSFLMGQPEYGRMGLGQGGYEIYRAEIPIHSVTVLPFYMGRHEVTQAQWKAVMGENPSNFKGDNLPVEQVSWNDAKAFCHELSRMTGKSYRLPTEAEWEYACRAGTMDNYYDEADLDAMAWYAENSGNRTHAVGQKRANAFGLFDMHGNVWEWCEDVWHDSYEGAPTDGSAWLSGGDLNYRVARGGSWNNGAAYCSPGSRSKYVPGTLLFGFRVVVTARTP